MSQPIRRSVWVACAAILGVGALVRGGMEIAKGWQQLVGEEHRYAAKLARLQGWTAVASEVEQQMAAVLGAEGGDSQSTTEAVSHDAAAAGTRLTEVRPQMDAVELMAEGTAQTIGAFLGAVAARRPPLQVTALGLTAQSNEAAPISLRVRVVPVPREGANS